MPIYDDILESSYKKLLERIKTTARGCDRNILPELIQHFGRDVVSKRKESSIKDVDSLIVLLQKQLLLQVDNVAELSVFIEKINSPQLRKYYDAHVCLVNEHKINQQRGHLSTGTKLSGLSPEVRNYIGNNIGKRWSELGRHLGVPDAELDEIEEKYKEFWRRSNCILDWFERHADSEKQQCLLVQALRQSKRKDLAEAIENL